MAIENLKLIHECSPEHMRMGTATLISDKETEEESKQKRVNMESEVSIKKVQAA